MKARDVFALHQIASIKQLEDIGFVIEESGIVPVGAMRKATWVHPSTIRVAAVTALATPSPDA